jgi:hypothetical protein
LLAVNGFDPQQLRANDLDLWLRVIVNVTWCYDPHPAVCYRIRTGSNLSSDIASRSYFRLRAVLKLRSTGGAHGVALERLVQYWSEQALRTAATRGSNEDWSRAIELTRNEVSPMRLALWNSVRLLGSRLGPFRRPKSAQ